MAIFKTGSLVGGISGTVGGLNFANTRYGPVIKKALTRTNKQTEAQHSFRARFYQTQRYWASLTDAQRASWNAAASRINFRNRLGIPRIPTGFELFSKYNLDLVDAPYIQTTPPPILSKSPQVSNVTLSASASGGINVQWYQPSPPSTMGVYFYGARSLTDRPAYHFKNWRHLHNSGWGSGNKSFWITTFWDNNLGHPLEGELVAIRIETFHVHRLKSDYIQATTTTVA